MKKEIKSIEDTDAFVNELLAEEKYVIDIQELPLNAGWIVQWQEHKTYKAFDGKEFPDEVWLTEDNRLLQIQDIEPEHCRNILRMMLRKEREAKAAMENFTDHLVDVLRNGGLMEGDMAETQHTLH